MEFKKLEQINSKLKTIDFKGKDYIEVNQRILAFRELFENGSIETEIYSLENGIVTIKAVVKNNDNKIISTGFAQEKEGSTFINKTSFIENCETSAIGRALGVLGIGVATSVSSAKEVLNAVNNQNKIKSNIVKQQKNEDNETIEDKLVTDKEVKFIIKILSCPIEEATKKNITGILKKYNKEKLEDLMMTEYVKIIHYVEELKKKQNMEGIL